MALNDEVKGVLEAYAGRMRTNNRKTDKLLTRKESLVRQHKAKGQRALLVAYVCEAVRHFALGEVREARRFFNGAYAFIAPGSGGQLVKQCLLWSALRAARKAVARDDHNAVWLLFAAVRVYGPDLEETELRRLFHNRLRYRHNPNGLHGLRPPNRATRRKAGQYLRYKFDPPAEPAVAVEVAVALTTA